MHPSLPPQKQILPHKIGQCLFPFNTNYPLNRDCTMNGESEKVLRMLGISNCLHKPDFTIQFTEFHTFDKGCVYSLETLVLLPIYSYIYIYRLY